MTTISQAPLWVELVEETRQQPEGATAIIVILILLWMFK